MNLDLEHLRRNADPDCKVCQGKGYRIASSQELDLGSGNVEIRKESLEIKKITIRSTETLACPLCFGPDGKPRDGQRVKK